MKYLIIFFFFIYTDLAYAEKLDFSSLTVGQDAKLFVRKAFDYWRDDSSLVTASMKVKRPAWEREFRLKSWTQGNDHSLVRFTAPKKDSGNATLTVDEQIWSFNPKTRRVIKIPPSMKSQNWMGSDFSYQDLAREDEVVTQYTHKVSKVSNDILVVESTPLDNAPVVWGKEVITINSDRILLQHDFYDQDGQLVKRFKTQKIGELGGKLFPTVVRMTKVEAENSWTEMNYEEAKFDLKLSPKLFTTASLQNPK